MKKWLTLVKVLLVGFVGAAEPADTIFTGGKVITVDEKFSITEAIAVRGERLTAVGANAEIEKLAGPETEKIDLKGATVLPGLIDSHVHAPSAAIYEFENEIPSFETVPDVLAYIRERAEKAEAGEWITMSQVFITRLRERRFPTRSELDEAAPKNPVFFRTGPDAAVNSMALELSEIDRDFKVPEGSNARIERDPATGELTGIIRSAGGMIKVASRSNAPDFERRKESLRQLIADYNSVGITGISDRNASDSGTLLYEGLRDDGQLNARVYLYRGINAGSPVGKIKEQLDRYAEHPLHKYDNKLWARGVKIFLDGGMLTGSAYMLKPWGVSESYGIDDREYRGILYVEPEKLYEIAKYALQRELQFTAHSVGDGAVETLVDTYVRIAENDFPIRDKRPCVTHCNFMTERAIDQMGKHGIVCDIQPAWLYLDGSTLSHHFGIDRLAWFQPYKTLFEKNVIVGGGSDHMQKIGSLRSVNPYNPFLGMWTTLVRQPRWIEEALHPEHKLSREQAIRLYTINNAYLTFEEKEKGSLEAGKLADFIVLDRDILECPVEEVRDIEVKQTWLGGKQVYSSE
jgi:predicted amidohydrolase YtcJ